jgi:solute carrier family 45 protein 1/2/4
VPDDDKADLSDMEEGEEEVEVPVKKIKTTSGYSQHPWGIFFTILGTVLLDFDADACQSPSRAYLLDVTLPG